VAATPNGVRTIYHYNYYLPLYYHHHYYFYYYYYLDYHHHHYMALMSRLITCVVGSLMVMMKTHQSNLR